MNPQKLPYEEPDIAFITPGSPEHQRIMELLRAAHPETVANNLPSSSERVTASHTDPDEL